MAVLALKISGPLQTWSIDRSPNRRQAFTQAMPTKSGCVGLLASAQGRARTEDISDLNALRFGVRMDKFGTKVTDYQIAKPGDDSKNTYISEVEYLEDATFVVAFESDNKDFLEQLREDVMHPVYPIYLGRKKCVPDPHIIIGIYDGSLEEVLTDDRIPRFGSDDNPPVYVETTNHPDNFINDYAETFDPEKRSRRMRGYRKVQ